MSVMPAGDAEGLAEVLGGEQQVERIVAVSRLGAIRRLTEFCRRWRERLLALELPAPKVFPHPGSVSVHWPGVVAVFCPDSVEVYVWVFEESYIGHGGFRALVAALDSGLGRGLGSPAPEFMGFLPHDLRALIGADLWEQIREAPGDLVEASRCLSRFYAENREALGSLRLPLPRFASEGPDRFSLTWSRSGGMFAVSGIFGPLSSVDVLVRVTEFLWGEVRSYATDEVFYILESLSSNGEACRIE